MPKKNRSKKKQSKARNAALAALSTASASAASVASGESDNSFPQGSQLTPHFPSSRSPSRSPSPPPPPPPLPPIEAPTNRHDPRFLGKGASKMIWVVQSDAEMAQLQMPRADKVVVNAFDEQMLDGTGTEQEMIAGKMEEQRNEYHFTRMVRDEFPDLVPMVYVLDSTRTFTPQPRYRYIKDRCDPLPKDADLFHHMIRISDRIVDKNWVYLDMKPGNIGQREGQVLLIDTDPSSFYRIPRIADDNARRRMRFFYRASCHMIILLYCLNFVDEIDPAVLQDFIRAKNYTAQMFRTNYYGTPMTDAMIAHYNNVANDQNGYPVRVHANDIIPPKTFISHYGTYDGHHALVRLQQIIDYVR